MKNTITGVQNKVRTTLYLTQENKRRLDRIPRGQKTALMNRAIAQALKELEKKENNMKFIDMISDIDPVNTELSSEVMVQHIRGSNDIPSIANQANDK